MREESHLEADVKLAERSGGAAPIGGLRERSFVEIAGRVRAMTITRENGTSDLRCMIVDNTGSVALIFQGRYRRSGHRARHATAGARDRDVAAPRGRYSQSPVRDRGRARKRRLDLVTAATIGEC